jgi:endoglucanase
VSVKLSVSVAQVGDPFSDHVCWERSEDMDTPRLTLQINETTPGTEVAAETAAALAAASIVFRASDPVYAERLLDTAMTVIHLHNPSFL